MQTTPYRGGPRHTRSTKNTMGGQRATLNAHSPRTQWEASGPHSTPNNTLSRRPTPHPIACGRTQCIARHSQPKQRHGSRGFLCSRFKKDQIEIVPDMLFNMLLLQLAVLLASPVDVVAGVVAGLRVLQLPLVLRTSPARVTRIVARIIVPTLPVGPLPAPALRGRNVRALRA